MRARAIISNLPPRFMHLVVIVLVAISLGIPPTQMLITYAANSVRDISNPDAYTCGQPGFITFEQYQDGYQLGASTIQGVHFTTTDGYTWLVGDFSTHKYNGKYPTGSYTSQGTHWAWLGVNEGRGRIDFPDGPASYFSLLVSNLTPVYLDAYDAGNHLLETAGPVPSNVGTGHMGELTINRQIRDLDHVIVHDSGNYFLIDAICTNAGLVQKPSQYRLPWASGSWNYTEGPHTCCANNYDGPNALDFQPLYVPAGGKNCLSPTGAKVDTNDWVYPMAEGVVTAVAYPWANGGNNNIGASLTVPVTLIIDDGNGVESYVTHLADTTVGIGSRVTLNTRLGHPSCYIEAYGAATGIHVHYVLRSKSDPNFMFEQSFCGWKLLKQGSKPESYPLVRGDQVVMPKAPVSIDSCPVAGAATPVLDSTYFMTSGDQTSGTFSVDVLSGGIQTIHVSVGPFGSDVDLRLVRPDGSAVLPSDAGVTYNKSDNSVSYSVVNAQPGDWTYHIVANRLDPGGEPINVFASESNGSNVDMSAPATSAVLTPQAPDGQNGWYVQPVMVSLVGTDPDGASDVAHTYYTLDSGPQQAYSSPFSLTADGIHHLTYWSVDQAGNIESAKTAIINIDQTHPNCTIIGTGTTADAVKYAHIAVGDVTSGLNTSSIKVTALANAKATTVAPNPNAPSGPFYAVGSSIPVPSAPYIGTVDIYAYKVTQSAGSSITLSVTDVAGNTTNCDPLFTSVIRSPARPQTDAFGAIAQDEGHVLITNGSPGVSDLTLSVNGQHLFPLHGLHDNQQVSLDISSALHAGTNYLFITTAGRSGSSASVLVSN